MQGGTIHLRETSQTIKRTGKTECSTDSLCSTSVPLPPDYWIILLLQKKISVQNKEKVTPSSNDRLQVDICLLYGITQAKHVAVPLLQDTHVSADRFSHHLYAFSTGQKSHLNIFRSGSCEQWECVPSAFTPGEHAQFCHAK